MAMCMISSMRRNGCITVFRGVEDGTRMNKSSKILKSDEILDIRL